MTLTELSAGVRLLAFLARVMPWRRFVPTLAARWFGVVSFRFVEGVSKPLYRRRDRQLAYHLTQIWIANGTGVDVRGARVSMTWRRKSGGPMDGRTLTGLWYPGIASDLVTPAGQPTEETDLPSNAAMQHLGLMVRSPSNKAYMVCTGTYHDLGAWQDYQHPGYELRSGMYDVDVLLEGRDGMRGYLKLAVQWVGGDSHPIVTVR